MLKVEFLQQVSINFEKSDLFLPYSVNTRFNILTYISTFYPALEFLHNLSTIQSVVYNSGSCVNKLLNSLDCTKLYNSYAKLFCLLRKVG